MARRVFTDYAEELNIRLGKRSDFTFTMREQHLNDALKKVANHYVHPELEGRTTGTLGSTTDNFTVVATDLWWPDLITDLTTPRNLVPGDKDRIEGMVKRAGNPAKFYWWGKVFYVDAKPTTDHSMQVDYIMKPAYWTSGSPVLDELFDPMILKWAAKLSFETLREFDEADKIGKEIAMYQAQMRLPVRQQRFNDRNTGIQVRLS